MPSESTIFSDNVRPRTKEEAWVLTTGIFPLDPFRRKAILVLQEHDIERCAYEPNASQALLDDETCVLKFPMSFQDEPSLALQNILDSGLFRPGEILIQSPYDTDIYEEVSSAPQRFALAKHMYSSTLCMYLGAKKVTVEQIDLRSRTGKTTLDLKGDRLGSSGKLSAESEELDKFRSQLHLTDEFTGGLPDVMAAEQLLRKTGLWADPVLRTLVDMRREGANQLTTRKLVLSLSSEAKRNLNVVSRLKIPSFVKLSAEYEKVVNEQYDYTLTMLVQF